MSKNILVLQVDLPVIRYRIASANTITQIRQLSVIMAFYTAARQLCLAITLLSTPTTM